MIVKVKDWLALEAACSDCRANFCSLEVMIISDTAVLRQHIYAGEYRSESMLRLGGGRCSALDRDTFMCSIYENRPWLCREFEMGSYECINERMDKV